MKWVRCVNKLGHGFTYDKIYEVKNYFDWNGLKYIELIDDNGRLIVQDMFPSHPNAKLWFEDAKDATESLELLASAEDRLEMIDKHFTDKQ